MKTPSEIFQQIKKEATENLVSISLQQFGEAFSRIEGLFDDLNFQMGDIDVISVSDKAITLSANSRHFLFHSNLFKNNGARIEMAVTLENNEIDIVAICKTKTRSKLSKLPGIIGDLLKPLDFLEIRDLAFIVTSKDLKVITSQTFPEFNGKAVKFKSGINLAGFIDLNSSGEIGKMVVAPLKPVLGTGPYFLAWNMRDRSSVSFDLELPKDIAIAQIFNLRKPKLVLKPVLPMQIDIQGIMEFKLPVGSIVVDGGFSYLTDGIRGQFSLDNVVEKIPAPFGFPGVHLQTFKLMVGLSNTQGPVVGAEGLFYIGPKKPTTNETGEASFGMKSNAYKFIFSVKTGTVTPVFVYLYLDRLTFEDYCRAMTNASLTLPAFMNKISLHQVMFHWCETPQGELKPDGTVAMPVFGLSAITNVFGYKTFTELYSEPSMTKGKLSADPINLGGGLLKITGKGTGTPAAYKGAVKVKPKGMELIFNSSGKPAYFSFSGDMEVFGLASAGVEGSITDSGLETKMTTKVADIIKSDVEVVLQNAEQFTAKTALNAKVSGLKISLGKLGNVKLNTVLAGDFAAEFNKGNYSNTMRVHFEFIGVKVDLGTISVSIRDLKNIASELEKFIREALVKELVGNVLLWLKATLEEMFEIAGEKLQEVAKLLKEEFKKTLDDGVQLMKSAGYKAAQIGEAAYKGFQAGQEEIAKALQKAGYTAEEVGQVLKDTIKLSGEVAAAVLKSAGYTSQQIARTLVSVYKFGQDQVMDVLKKLNATVFEVAEVLKSVFQLPAKQIGSILKQLEYGAEAVGSALKAIGEGTDAVADVLTDVFKQPAETARDILGRIGFPAGDVLRRFPRPSTFVKSPVFAKHFMKW